MHRRRFLLAAAAAAALVTACRATSAPDRTATTDRVGGGSSAATGDRASEEGRRARPDGDDRSQRDDAYGPSEDTSVIEDAAGDVTEAPHAAPRQWG